MTGMLNTRELAVGYNRRILLQGISISLDRGKILTLTGKISTDQ